MKTSFLTKNYNKLIRAEGLNDNGEALKGDKEALKDDGEAFESDAKALNDDGEAFKRVMEKH